MKTEKGLTVKEAARLSGVSVRTLRYYHQIGLLYPAGQTRAGYRLYGPQELDRLRQILLYRELGFALKDIRALLAAGAPGRQEALERQRALLRLQRERLDRLLDMTDQMLRGEQEMDFKAFDKTELEARKTAYAREARERWGDTPAYREFQKRGYGKEDWEPLQAGMEDILRRFAAKRGAGPQSPEVQALVEEWREYLTAHFYPCTLEVLDGLGRLYAQDPRFGESLGAIAPGLGDFVAQAIRAYCAARGEAG